MDRGPISRELPRHDQETADLVDQICIEPDALSLQALSRLLDLIRGEYDSTTS